MRLDLDSLAVQSFSTSISEPIAEPAEPGAMTVITVVTVPVDPETHFEPCTRQLTCRTCV